MTLAETKKKMLTWTDFYGGDLPDYERIKNAKTKRELERVLEEHRDFMESMLSDAHSHIDSFKRELGLDVLP